MKIFAKMFKNKSEKRILGLAEGEQYFCLAYFQQQLFTHWLDKTQDLHTEVSKLIPFSSPYFFVRPIPFQYIWRKYLFLPISYTDTMIYRQLLYVLQHEIPLSIEELYFDYQIFSLPQENLKKVILYALKKDYADKLMITNHTILDCELYSFARGFNYFYPTTQSRTEYYMKNKKFSFTGKNIELSDSNEKIEEFAFPRDILEPQTYILAVGACLWNGVE